MYLLVALVFVLGYVAIAMEHPIKVDKAASALMLSVVLWTLLVIGADTFGLATQVSAGHEAQIIEGTNLYASLREHLGEIAEILFFLIGAMVIIELIDAHDGFRLITDRITTTSPVKLLWAVSFIGFFLSSVIDNLTSTIVMVSLLAKLVKTQHNRWLFVGMLVIAANAGGAFSPIGDVTTTMLWIG